MSDLEKIRNEEAELERQLAEVRARRIAAEQAARPETTRSRVSLRVLVLAQLMDAGFALNSQHLAQVLHARVGKRIPATRFGTLSNDEEKSFQSSRAKPVYLCHSLSHETGEPIKRYWCRSDWPLQDRTFGPMTSRVLFLKCAIWFIDLAKNANDAAEPEILKYQAADQARDAGLPVKRGEFPFDMWVEALKHQLEKFEKIDTEQRQMAAAQLAARLSEQQQLFGAPSGMVSLPGSSKKWESASA